MTIPLLCIIIAAVPVAILCAWLDHAWREQQKQISTSEWLRRMRSLPPSAPPVRLQEGSEGISRPVRSKRAVRPKRARVKPTRKNT
jgi:hypothetical protein